MSDYFYYFYNIYYSGGTFSNYKYIYNERRVRLSHGTVNCATEFRTGGLRGRTPWCAARGQWTL